VLVTVDKEHREWTNTLKHVTIYGASLSAFLL